MILQEIADMIFGPVLSLLGQVVTWLQGVSLAAWHGLDPSVYLGPFAWLSAPWLRLIQQIVLAGSVFATILVVRAGYGLYLDLKAGVKWW